jgi:transcription-repair coupling factor (superfamily II helicase)
VKRIRIPSKEIGFFHPSLPRASYPAIIFDQWLHTESPILIVVGSSLSESEVVAEDITAHAELHQQNKKKIEFHLLEENPSDSHPEAFERNCNKLSLLSSLIEGRAPDDIKTIIAATPESLLAPCPSKKEKTEKQMVISRGMELDFGDFQQALHERMDYSSEILCEEPGQYSLRGGIIDVYPVNANQPYRIDFFGNVVDDIRAFDPTSQRTSEKKTEIVLSSLKGKEENAREGEFFSYLSDSTTWAFIEPETLISEFPLAFHQSEEKKFQKACFELAWKDTSSQNIFLGFSEIDAGSGIFEKMPSRSIQCETSSQALGTGVKDSLSSKEGRYRINYLFELLEKQDKGHEIIIAAGADAEKKRILDLIKDESSLKRLDPRFIKIGLRDGFSIEKEDAQLYLSHLLQSDANGLSLATAREILGRERSRRPVRSQKARVQRKNVDQALDFSELVSGDFLVHHQHGICRFEKLGKIENAGRDEEAITLEFADGLMLHVPLQESHLLSRYVGLQKTKPKLAKLGGKLWAKTRQAAESAALDLAADLLRLQATRESKSGFAFSPDDQWQKEFEDAFPYVETPDQQKAIDQVKEDMEEEDPMDRLVCGDVGFGKTEVALRAAFKAIMDGKQVAILAPTTILCQQHYNHFSERMADYPITVEMLSRFRSSGEQRKIVHKVASGNIDLIIGTHRILSPDLKFNDLGLLVVDEEQRFGVQHKETIKKIRENVDVLTLSATPIPRTLYFAMVGARDLSSIETAPVTRRPIRTEVMNYSPQVLERAIQTEVNRGGQIFYLHNRVKTIESVARKLRIQFPKLRIAVGHGQMNEDELEKIMTEFVACEYDILVCTTIIESGLDIPNCNTIIIEGADKFGLSQLYQLRGRVGRFDKQAYAYLLLNRHLTVSDQARKRLSAIKQVSHFGAGLQIALRDLELRGAGNLLGSEQSGHVAGIGFELYCRLLRESVSRLKGEEISLRPNATIRLDFLSAGPDEETSFTGQFLPSYLPEEYASEPRLRIECYRRLAKFRTTEEVDDFQEELEDRFGPLPQEGLALLHEARIRCLAEEAEFDHIETRGHELWCREMGRNRDGSKKFHRSAGRIPRISSKEPLLKLKEIIRFLKIAIHGKQNE